MPTNEVSQSIHRLVVNLVPLAVMAKDEGDLSRE